MHGHKINHNGMYVAIWWKLADLKQPVTAASNMMLAVYNMQDGQRRAILHEHEGCQGRSDKINDEAQQYHILASSWSPSSAGLLFCMKKSYHNLQLSSSATQASKLVSWNPAIQPESSLNSSFRIGSPRVLHDHKMPGFGWMPGNVALVAGQLSKGAGLGASHAVAISLGGTVLGQ